ncbi:hypothetical protein TrRE_jg1907 [Triparma retinervis]|uniref:Uncharacterized protein n=1 Tax=Triparma retinervis TaxID=2557542 RepID=A0A9W7ADU2_9STRA|nr:hypothetical protein TrRE_jg1907 [Triparma retinervis]
MTSNALNPILTESIHKDRTSDDPIDDLGTESFFLPLGAREGVLPHWIQSYMIYHGREKKRFMKGQGPDVKFLVLSCTTKDCRGGTVDRLTPVPFFVLLAALSKRVLLIRWSMPSELENFLVPPRGGMDWRCPPQLSLSGATGPKSKGWLEDSTLQTLKEKMNKYDDKQVLILSFGAGSPQFEKMERLIAEYTNQESGDDDQGAQDWSAIFPTLFSKVFTPSPRLAEFMINEISKLGLVRGNFLAVHSRVYYPKGRKDGQILYETVEEQKQIVRNAIDCAVNIKEVDDAHIYVACDRIEAATLVKDEYESIFPGVVKVDVGVEEDQHIAFSDFNDGVREDVTVEPFLPTFSDLWIMGMARCVVHGVGGFGSFSAMLAGNRCTYFHRRGEKRFWMGEHTRCEKG